MKTTIQDHPVNEQQVLDNPRPESRKTAMAAKPFWTLRVHDKRDVLVARHKARQIAHMLHFPPLQEACIAAGAFAIAAQARDFYEICDLCFQLDNHQLMVFARPLSQNDVVAALASHVKTSEKDSIEIVVGASPQQATAAAKVEPGKSAPPMKLAKPLPEAACDYSADELSFLIGRINDQAPADLFGELGKQNQEILLLLHLLNHPREQLSNESTSAA